MTLKLVLRLILTLKYNNLSNQADPGTAFRAFPPACSLTQSDTYKGGPCTAWLICCVDSQTQGADGYVGACLCS